MRVPLDRRLPSKHECLQRGVLSLHIGDQVVVGAKSAVYKDVPDGEFVTGIPARPHREWLKANAGLQRLDQLRERLGRLEEAVRRLEAPEEGGDR